MAETSYLGNNLHGDLKPKDYFGKIDSIKKSNPEKIDKSQSFQKMLKTNFDKPQAANKLTKLKPSLKAQQESKLQKSSKIKDTNGTDFALRKLSEDFEKQILGIMWNLVFESTNKEFEGGIGEEIFHKELVNEMVNLSKTGEMGEIATSIYLELVDKVEN